MQPERWRTTLRGQLAGISGSVGSVMIDEVDSLPGGASIDGNKRLGYFKASIEEKK
jgi:hypothetical protein